jgi:hypothetical protein
VRGVRGERGERRERGERQEVRCKMDDTRKQRLARSLCVPAFALHIAMGRGVGATVGHGLCP